MEKLRICGGGCDVIENSTFQHFNIFGKCIFEKLCVYSFLFWFQRFTPFPTDPGVFVIVGFCCFGWCFWMSRDDSDNDRFPSKYRIDKIWYYYFDFHEYSVHLGLGHPHPPTRNKPSDVYSWAFRERCSIGRAFRAKEHSGKIPTSNRENHYLQGTGGGNRHIASHFRCISKV